MRLRLGTFVLIFGLFSLGWPAAFGGIPLGEPLAVSTSHRVAFRLADDVKMESVVASVAAILSDQSGISAEQFAALVHARYKFDSDQPLAATKDIYFDAGAAAQSVLVAKHHAYRLRYTWDDARAYSEGHFFWFLSRNFPNACELDFRTEEFNPEVPDGVRRSGSKVAFERGEASAWALSPERSGPWPEKSFMQTATEGTFEGHDLLPARDSLQVSGVGVELKPVLAIETLRKVIFLRASSPWGKGENPDEVFQVTIEKSLVLQDYLQGPAVASAKDVVVEISVEPNASLTARLAQAAALAERGEKLGVPVKEAPLIVSAAGVSKKAAALLNSDLTVLRQRISDEVAAELSADPLGPVSIYGHFMGADGPVGDVATKPESSEKRKL